MSAQGAEGVEGCTDTEAPVGAVAPKSKPAARERLLQAAEELFYSQGIGATGIEAVIARAGVAKGSLYWNFSSKDELVTDYVRRLDAAWWAWLEPRLEAAGVGAQERLDALLDAVGEWVSRPGYCGCAFVRAASELPEGHQGRAVAIGHKARMRGVLRQIGTEGGAVDADCFARQAQMLIDGAMVCVAISGDTGALGSARKGMMTLLVAARAG
ncbi:MAG: TetR family transcriptional regulator [Planctomyces sp.]|nr:TetR family transcriptional regulator [Planctomyces sp.]MBA4119738.1 TetR family transcriptional regulator [Isosphaera sp.]